MKKLPKPPHLALDVFTTCNSRVRDLDLQTRLGEIAPNVVSAAADYENLAERVELHLFPATETVGRVLCDELKKVYTDRMVGQESPGRWIYDEIIASPKNGTCPLCNERQIKQLDHHLPKSSYPILSVVPVNLIPTCSDCNKTKTAGCPTNQEEQTFHPYFDDFDSEQWLYATVAETRPPALVFETRQPAGWDDVKYKRLTRQFANLELHVLYAVKAATQLRGIQGSLSDLHAAGSAEAVRLYLIGEYESRRRADLNFWQTATYQALAESPWYCNGGFVID
jgi:hypothetical protein